jgi:hypothetical protein
LGRKLFIDAQALIKVPSTEKCSALMSPGARRRRIAGSTIRLRDKETASS